MKKEFSLKSRKLFLEVYQQGKRYQGQGFRVYILKIKEPEYPEIFLTNHQKKIKIGIGIGRRYGSAVMRNKAKRILRSVCNELLNDMKDGYVIIFKPDERFKETPYILITEQIRTIFTKAGVMNL